MISLEKLKILTLLQKLPKNVGDLGKVIIAKGFKKLPKVQKNTQSGHTDHIGSYIDKNVWCVTLVNYDCRVALTRKLLIL